MDIDNDPRSATVRQSVRAHQPQRRQRQNAADLDRKHIEAAITSIGLPDLVVPVKSPSRKLLVDLAVLNRMRVASLQNDLAVKVREFDAGAEESTPDTFSAIDRLLGKYCKAIEDWELMEKYSARAKGEHEKDPFFISTHSFLQHKILRRANLLDRDYIAKDDDSPKLPLGSRPSARMLRDMEEFITRFAFAVFGGLSLVGPMILMVLRKDILTSLLTVSVFVLLFAFIVSICAAEASPSVVMTMVTAYAAVLVVFVGASSGGG